MSRDQNAGRSHAIKIDNSNFERVEKFKYLGTTLTNQNSIQEQIKSSFSILVSDFFLILAHSVYKMCIIQEQNRLNLWNKLHFEEEKTESTYRV